MTTTRTIPGISTGGATNPLKGLLAYGQSPWMDYIRRDLLIGGVLKKYIDSNGLRGMTSNPAIFEKAIAARRYQCIFSIRPRSADLCGCNPSREIARMPAVPSADSLLRLSKCLESSLLWSC